MGQCGIVFAMRCDPSIQSDGEDSLLGHLELNIAD
jgi:hypothetical protein